MNLTLLFSRKHRRPEHYFSVWCLGNSQKLLTTNQFLLSTIFFTIMNISFFNLRFDLFLIITKEVNQIRNNVVNSPCFRVLLCTHYGPWQCFSTYFCKLKEIGVFSCDYGSIDDRKNEQLLNFDIITPQIPTCKAPNRFRESYNVKYFKVIKLLKRLHKVETYFQPKPASMMEPFCEYT